MDFRTIYGISALKEVRPRCQRTGARDQLQQVHELNRLFLAFLQSVKREHWVSDFRRQRAACVRPAAEQLDTIAEFPRALFRTSQTRDREG